MGSRYRLRLAQAPAAGDHRGGRHPDRGAALLLLARIGALAAPLPRWILGVGTWVLAAVFALAGVSNLIHPQDGYARDWHIYFFGPLLMILAALCAIAARSKPPR